MPQWNMVTRKHLTIVLCLGIEVAIHVPDAVAQDAVEVAAIFDLLDTNHDGRVVPSEFAINKIMVMAARDENRDGKLTREEVLISDDAFSAVDRDNDGTVSGLEFVDGGLGRFENLDRNGDHILEIGELEAWILAPN